MHQIFLVNQEIHQVVEEVIMHHQKGVVAQKATRRSNKCSIGKLSIAIAFF